MQLKAFFLVATISSMAFLGATPVCGTEYMDAVTNAETLTGDAATACEAVLCLSSGTQPSECDPSLNEYFSIIKDKWSDTLSARRSFLNQCPSSSEEGMANLISVITAGAGKCTAESLNSDLAYRVRDPADSEKWITLIDDDLPSYCTNYSGHEWTDGVASVEYIGTPSTGGYWVDK